MLAYHEDPMGFWRGCLWALPLSLLSWAVIIAGGVALYRWAVAS